MTTGYALKLTNLGLAIRPDLIDAHTLHFHGFRNALPIFDGEPHSSVGVPIVRDLTYFYKPHDPGTYMYHCHFEETEHVHMGMVGGCFIKPDDFPYDPGQGWDGVSPKYAYGSADVRGTVATVTSPSCPMGAATAPKNRNGPSSALNA